MHVFACQYDIVWEDKASNHALVDRMLADQRIPSGSLIVLPEMFDTGFTMHADKAADDRGDSRRFLQGLAARYRSAVVAGVVQRDEAGRGLNQAVVFGPDGEELAWYTKMHPFTPGGEHEHYRAGESVVTFSYAGFTIAPLICYDLRFPERFREAVRLGAEVYVVIANWPDSRAAHWTTLLSARAIENQAFTVGVNRTGYDPRLHYPGLSMIVDPRGRVLAQASDEPVVLSAKLEHHELSDYRRKYPFLADMRG